MEFLKNIVWTPLNILKALGLLLLALLALSIISSFFGRGLGLSGGGTSLMAPMAPSMDISDNYARTGNGMDSKLGGMERGTGVMPQPSGGSVGADAEAFEVTQYSASVETNNSQATCGDVHRLKDLEYVVFESASENDRGCTYTFKVLREKAPEILEKIKSLHPKQLTGNTYTIQNEINDVTSETEILERKLASIDETLTNAVRAYDEISALATKTQDVDSLAKIINNKILLIERLTQERMNTAAQLEQLSRSKAQQTDRLGYTNFSVYVYENKFFDVKFIKESWKNATKSFVQDVNAVAQAVTIELLGFLLRLLELILYFFLGLFALKFVWRNTKRIWSGQTDGGVVDAK